MKRVLVLIDGFNIYHSIASNPYFPAFRKYRWLNLKKLVQCFMVQNEQIVDILYFSAYMFWKPEKVARHQLYTKALRSEGIKIIMSEFKKKQVKCEKCKEYYDKYEEKQTDVQIAINLFKGAIDDSFDKAIVVSGDSDLMPALEAVKLRFPKKELHLLFPSRRTSELLKQIADQYSKIREKHLASSQFPNEIILPDGEVLRKPVEYF